MTLQHARVTLDGGPTYDAYISNECWNGFVCPWFSLETAKRIGWDLATPDSESEFDPTTDTFRIDTGNGDWDEFRGEDIEIDGHTLHLYPIGAEAWTWTLTEAVD